VYVVFGVARTIPLQRIFKGVMPFLAALIICNLLLLIFPGIATFLPSLM
jgi:TRAP-type C4-dicarboxylate transport system permease large subunit